MYLWLFNLRTSWFNKIRWGNVKINEKMGMLQINAKNNKKMNQQEKLKDFV